MEQAVAAGGSVGAPPGPSSAQEKRDGDLELRLPTSKDELAARLRGRCQDGDTNKLLAA